MTVARRSSFRRVSRRAGSLGLVALSALPLGACGSYERVIYEDRAMTVAHVAGSALSVVNANGSVTAERADRAGVLVEARLFSDDAERLAFATLRADRQGDGSLRVWVEWPGERRRGAEGGSIRVFTPGADGVSVRSSNGSVVLSGLGGTADVTTSNGSVVVRDHAGDVRATSSNGSVRGEGVSGSMEFFTTNGSVVVSDARGPVLAETTNASVTVQTADGNPGPVRVLTTNGQVQLDLGSGFMGLLRMGTSNGSIRVRGLEGAELVESRDNYIELRIGKDETVSAVKTSNGSVRVSGSEPSRGSSD